MPNFYLKLAAPVDEDGGLSPQGASGGPRLPRLLRCNLVRSWGFVLAGIDRGDRLRAGSPGEASFRPHGSTPEQSEEISDPFFVSDTPRDDTDYGSSTRQAGSGLRINTAIRQSTRHGMQPPPAWSELQPSIRINPLPYNKLEVNFNFPLTAFSWKPVVASASSAPISFRHRTLYPALPHLKRSVQ